ncbi:Hypothetical protein CINCED_3A013473, partial [Cinara cedri]|uniref:Uncharacterized protein n=1 Tax=Cinara cedri TaxID=506608 RepID=A0A5E4NT96_9HEMI
MERKILRKVYGPIKDNNSGEWRRRKNTELEILFQNTTISEVIKKRRLQWAGQAWRTHNELIRAVLEQNREEKDRWEDPKQDGKT